VSGTCYDRRMKLALALTLLLAACGSKPKPESPIVDEGSDVPETCCCMTRPLTSLDGHWVYAMANRIECSTQQGECMPDVQCQAFTPTKPSDRITK